MIKIGRWFIGKGLILFLIIAMTFVACGGGDDDGGDPATNNANLDGLWYGSYGTISTDIWFLMRDGEMYGFDENEAIYDGEYTVTNSDNNFSASLRGAAIEIEITGSGTEQNQINATYTCSNGNTGNLILNFDPIYNNPSSFELLSGEYTSQESVYSIDTDGGITGTFLGECQISGAFSIIDSEHNLYGIDLDLSQCDIEGQYSGLATVGEEDDYIAILSNTSRRLLMIGDR